MVLFYVLATLVFLGLGIVAYMFYLLKKEAAKEEEGKVEAIANPSDLIRPVDSVTLELQYKKKVEDLEEELKAISEKGMSQAQEALAMVDALTKENEQLKQERSRSVDEQQQLQETARQVDQLKQDNFLLQSQLESTHGKVEELQLEAVTIRQKMTDELQAANAQVEQLRSEKEAILLHRKNSAGSTQALTRECEELKTVNAALQRQIDELKANYAQLREINAALTEKAQTLQFDLTKHRAQASGLEKICENYRLQLEKRV